MEHVLTHSTIECRISKLYVAKQPHRLICESKVLVSFSSAVTSASSVKVNYIESMLMECLSPLK